MAADVLEMSFDLEQRTLAQPWYESMVVIERFQVEVADRPRAQFTPGAMVVHSTIFHMQLPSGKTHSARSTFFVCLETVSTSANVGLLTMVQDG